MIASEYEINQQIQKEIQTAFIRVARQSTWFEELRYKLNDYAHQHGKAGLHYVGDGRWLVGFPTDHKTYETFGEAVAAFFKCLEE